MDSVNRGEQHTTIGVGFYDVANLQKWYKHDFLGISDFSLIKKFTACNMSVNELRDRGRGGVIRNNNLVKWEFYSAVAEEFFE